MVGYIDRRRMVGMTLATGAGLAGVLAGGSTHAVWANPQFTDNPFSLGVASGDPLPDGVVLWTRLAPEPLALDGRGGMPDHVVPVRWEVATDDGFRAVVARGTTRATPELGHSVHVEVTGLKSNREYYYRFRAGREISPVGRTKTAPKVGARLDELRFAFASCQNYPHGFYTAYQHMAGDDLDLVVHLGDYIYEGPAQGAIGRGHLPEHEIYSLADYRVRHAQYKTDADLQAAHATFPWIVTFDDHEVENNWAGGIPEDPDEYDSPEDFLQRRAHAFQVYYEHMPLRRDAMPKGPDIQIYRRLAYGDLAEFNVLDNRQYRDNQACGDGLSVPCEEWYDESRTYLGDEQERWLLDGLGASKATWNVVAQQQVMVHADRDTGDDMLLPMDNWNGYPFARQRLYDGIVERDVDNVVVISGDAHCSMVADMKLDFEDPDSAVLGTEFLGTSISSGRDGADMDQRGEEWSAANPHMKFYNQQRGYVRCTVSPDEWRTDYQVVPYVSSPDAEMFTRTSFVVESGHPGAEEDGSSPSPAA